MCDMESMDDSKVMGVQPREATFAQTCDFACKIAGGTSKILEIAGMVYVLVTCMMSYLMRHFMTIFCYCYISHSIHNILPRIHYKLDVSNVVFTVHTAMEKIQCGMILIAVHVLAVYLHGWKIKHQSSGITFLARP